MGSKPKVVKQDPEGDARRAAEKATAEANTKKAMRRSGSSAGSSMSVLGGEGGKEPTGLSGAFSTFLNDQKSKLGGG
jgi:hypothetical protein